ncbi:MAG: cupin domain-containing protein [Polyangiaceae bacterium]
MKNPLSLGMTPSAFLSEFWQKKRLFVKAALPDFRDPLTPDELAGLACEDAVESRLVDSKTWRVTFGPQKEKTLRALPKTNWTLLVQEVQRFVPEAAMLLDAFSFLPNHRIDDVMVSFAPKGGNVGPHDDSYDVFLLQGQGRRRWKIDARKQRDTTLKAGLELKILKRFEPQEEWVAERGDILYLPPGVGHHGVALDDCLTYSIGFRAPNRRELWRELVEDASHAPEAAQLYRDPNVAECMHPGELDDASLVRVREMVRALDLSDAAIDRFFGRFATRLKPGHELEPAPKKMSEAAVRKAWLRGDSITRSEECRFSFLRRPKKILFYYGGYEVEVPRSNASLVEVISSHRHFSIADVLPRAASSSSAITLITDLLNDGALAFAPPARGRSARP